jgi:hypothetical protein
LRRRLLLVAITLAPIHLAAQTGGFVATLGRDTVHIERFTRFADRIEGTVVTRSPRTRVAHYVLRLDASGAPSRYELRSTRGDGTADTLPTSNGVLVLGGDSITREVTVNGAPVVQRLASPGRVLPGPMLPYVGVTYLVYELAFQEARARANADGLSSIRLLTLMARQMAPGETRAWFIGPDSVELDYFGQARSGYKLDGAGRLIRADWTGTTYRYRIARLSSAPDVDAIAAAWHAADARGAAMGPLSPRDSAVGSVGATQVVVSYSRPSKRGRRVWGEVVPDGRVWRLGADMATEVRFSTDVRVGDVAVPAGSYSLWMLPAADGSAQLIVNKQARIFGTQYNPAHDLARIPLVRRATPEPVERLTLEVSGQRLLIRWDDAEWSVALASAAP